MTRLAHTKAKGLLAGVTACCLAIVGAVVLTTMPSVGAPGDPWSKVADPASWLTYPRMSSGELDATPTSAPGRIWTDKSVFSSNVSLVDEGTTPSISTLNVASGEFAVALSALGSTRSVQGVAPVPVDVVILIDNSGSMTSCVHRSGNCTASSATSDTSYTRSRVYAMVQAVDEAIDLIMTANPLNRVSIVRFDATAAVIENLRPGQQIPSGVGAGHYIYLEPPSGNSTMYIRTYSNNTNTSRLTAANGSATNIQRGVVAAMNVLAGQNRTAVTGANQRLPNVIVFTDGEPTQSVNNATWWDPPSSAGNHGVSGPGSTQFIGGGFKAAMAGAYLKNKINDVYNDPVYNFQNGVAPVAAGVYTVAIGIGTLTEVGANLARATLNPKGQLGLTTNTMNIGFTNAWNTYAGGSSVSVPVASGTNYTVNHPTGAAAPYDPSTNPSGLKYNDQYYEVETSAELVGAFKDLALLIVTSTPNFPVQIESGLTAFTSGYVTFEDHLGPFMEVSAVNLLSYCTNRLANADLNTCESKVFSNPKTTYLGSGVTQYIFEGNYAANHLAGEQDLAGVIITVRRYESLARGDEISIRFPASLLPVNDASVTLDIHGDPVSLDFWEARPVHLYYKAAPKAGVIDALANPRTLNTATTQDGTELESYIAANTHNGEVRFYTNDFDTVTSGGTTTITPQVSANWLPSALNHYYRFTKATTLYADEALTNPLTQAQWNSLSNDTPVWFGTDEYYFTDASHTKVAKRVVPHSVTKAGVLAAQSGTYVVATVGGYMTAPAGMPNASRWVRQDAVKCLDLQWVNNMLACPAMLTGDGNLTETSPMARFGFFQGERLYHVLGNNGYLGYDLPGRLLVSKALDYEPGLTPHPDTLFRFKIDLIGADSAVLTGEYAYEIFQNSDSLTPIASGKVTSGQIVSIKAWHFIVVYGLPSDATYVVTEQALPPGYSYFLPVGGTNSGSVTGGETATAAFTNNYMGTATSTTGMPLTFKEIVGRGWGPTDEYYAIICPEGGDSIDCETVPFEDNGEGRYQANFGTRIFNAPGIYSYLVTEASDIGIAGISYSAAIYRWVVTVVDDGFGNLSQTNRLYKLIDDDGTPSTEIGDPGEVVFINNWDLTQFAAYLDARKMMTESHYAGYFPPDVSFEFTFRYMGSNLEQASPTVVTPLEWVGYPAGTTEVTVDSLGMSIHSPLLLSTVAHAGNTFYYMAFEVDDGSYPAAITLSQAVWVWRVMVSADIDGIRRNSVHCETTLDAITAATPFGDCDPQTGTYAASTVEDRTFLNYHDPEPAIAQIDATKTLTGRTWTSADSFTFELTPIGTTTPAAVTAGWITYNTTASCPGVTIIGTKASRTLTSADQTAGAAPFCFDITFARPGNYQFALTETAWTGSSHGMIYDTHTEVYDVVVIHTHEDATTAATITRRGDTTGTAAASFTNRYQATEQYAGQTIAKTLNGRDLHAGEFTFVIKAENEGSCTKASLVSPSCIQTMTNTDSYLDPTPAVIPIELNFTQSDLGKVFRYTIYEQPGTLAGVSYDSTVYDFTVWPLYDDATGSI
ncbi:MAG: hypothetical protein LBE83_01885, partial [Propionibacteriaceae bacterium]|nr:hypothetical protein [Propionibacteriaceae bacterium]